VEALGQARPSSGDFKAQIGHQTIPDLKEGRATLEIVATNNSWGRFFRGGRSEIKLGLPVRFHPPQIAVLTPQVYVNQGGCDLVLFKISPGTSESGIQVGPYFSGAGQSKVSSRHSDVPVRLPLQP